MVTAVGIGVVWPKWKVGGRLTTLLAGTVNRSDSPDRVCPLTMHVMRARTGPKLAGMFGSTQEPSAFTCTLRLRTLTVQFSLGLAKAAGGAPPIRPVAATGRA